ncbi:putative urea active transporter 1 [Venturia nashicola]|uniref:Putative urea active transporter 1 n=1 Tax=Venturia nashicola TaxID=86259 RepID=A0A4Z1NWP6_9PEZI|nr:putative urea active transporter 1 [Venturia nashicola]
MISFLLLSFGLLFNVVSSAYYEFDLYWINAAPGGITRPVIGINGEWPPPTIEADVGEEITVVVHNNLGNATTAIHWHGIHQTSGLRGIMDGAGAVTQCPISPGSTFTYSFAANHPGSFWYHSHDSSQHPDGLRAPMIIRDPRAPYEDEIEDEFVLTLSDVYEAQARPLLAKYQSAGNTFGTEPVPRSILINDGQGANYTVEAGKTYLFRIMNIAASPAFFFNIEDHDMTIVAMDGIYTQRTTAQTIHVGTGQRYDVLVTMDQDDSKNFDMSALIDLAGFNPATKSNYEGPKIVQAVLHYGSDYSPKPRSVKEWVSLLPAINDITISPLEEHFKPPLEPVDLPIRLHVNRTRSVPHGVPRATINDKTFIPQKVPALFTALSIGDEFNTNPEVYGGISPYIVRYGQVVEITIINDTPVPHPWHLHGHSMQIIDRTYYGSRTPPNIILPDNAGVVHVPTPILPKSPMRRDTVYVYPNGGTLTLRFRADNPGVWLLHCHIEWHVSAGMQATIIEAPDVLAGMGLVIPEDHKENSFLSALDASLAED